MFGFYLWMPLDKEVRSIDGPYESHRIGHLEALLAGFNLAQHLINKLCLNDLKKDSFLLMCWCVGGTTRLNH